MRRVLVRVVLAAALAVLSAQAAAAAPGPPDLSVKATNAILKGRLHTAWTLLHPRQRAVTTEKKWTRCHATELAAMGRLKILGVEAATTKVGTAVFPPLPTTSACPKCSAMPERYSSIVTPRQKARRPSMGFARFVVCG
jgi:hypothetical protein